MTDKSGQAPRRARPAPRGPGFAQWSKTFLAELAATSNIAAAARKAGISTSLAYDARRTNPEFNRKWQAALCEGYDHLEMELLHRLRTGEIKPPGSAKKGVRVFDNATAFRQLAVHREAVSRSRAVRDNEDTEAILASIDAKLERMRQRWLAARKRDADAENDEAQVAGPSAEVDPGAAEVAGQHAGQRAARATGAAE
jgi:hypothetical protein